MRLVILFGISCGSLLRPRKQKSNRRLFTSDSLQMGVLLDVLKPYWVYCLLALSVLVC